MQFYPVLGDVQAAVFHVLDAIASTMQNVPTNVLKLNEYIFNNIRYI